MRKLDDILLVKELDAKFFDHTIREDLLHNAICTPSAGFDYDYERLELLGQFILIVAEHAIHSLTLMMKTYQVMHS